MNNNTYTGFPSVDKPWLKYYSEEAIAASVPESTIFDYLYESNKNHLNEIAMDYFGNQITYSQLFDGIERVAQAFSAMGVKAGDVVTISSVTTPEIIFAFYALNRLGAVSNMADPRTSVEGIHHYIKEVNSRIVVAIDVALPKIIQASENTGVENIISLSPFNSLPPMKKILMKLLKGNKTALPTQCMDWNAFIENQAPARYASYTPGHCCSIIHTGGTTGMPKGVMLSDDNINAVALQMKYSNADLVRGDTFLNIMPPFIAYGIVLGLHSPLVVGWKTVIIPQFKPEEFDKLLLQHKPNGVMGVPSYWTSVMASPKMSNKDVSFLKNILLGGDKITPEFENELNHWLQQHHCSAIAGKGYSMTEASSCTTFAANRSNKVGSVGIPLPKTIVAIFDPDTLAELPFGQEGEICIQTPTMMLGYYENPEETKNVLRTHSDGTVWLHSGDLGYVDPDGFVYVIGRLKRVIIRNDAFKVFPAQLEDAVNKHPAIDACCAVGKKDRLGQTPVVFVVSRNKENTALKEELFALCKNELPEYAQPTEIFVVNDLPLTPIGKVDYRKLEEMANT